MSEPAKDEVARLRQQIAEERQRLQRLREEGASEWVILAQAQLIGALAQRINALGMRRTG